MRLDRILANSGYGTRSQVRDLIRAGRVCLDGIPLRDPSVSLTEGEASRVIIDGSPAMTSRYLYIALNKPDGVLTALEDKRLPTIADLIPKEFLFKGLAPVGRLDFHTTGLLILTNNGILAHRLMSPKWHVDKKYLITYAGDPLTDRERLLFKEGMVLLEEGHSPVRLAPAKLDLLGGNTCRLTITEGKTHQVRRMIAAVSRSVTELHREAVGGVTLAFGPDEGCWRYLEPEEISVLFTAADMQNTER